MSIAREELDLAPGEAIPTILGQLGLLNAMQKHIHKLS